MLQLALELLAMYFSTMFYLLSWVREYRESLQAIRLSFMTNLRWDRASVTGGSPAEDNTIYSSSNKDYDLQFTISCWVKSRKVIWYQFYCLKVLLMFDFCIQTTKQYILLTNSHTDCTFQDILCIVTAGLIVWTSTHLQYLILVEVYCQYIGLQ